MSSSCNATAPIDISTNASTNPIKVGSFICSYDPDLCTGAAVSMSEDRVYLTIKCNSSNDSKVVFYGGGSFIPTEIRIYAPSLHTYNGSHTDAEMLIVHSPGSSNSSNSGSSGLIVSVPISISSNGTSTDMSAILQAANTINPGTLSVNSSAPINEDINVNDLIPAKPYYVYYGTLPYDSCGGNYYYAVFTDTISAVGPISNMVASGIATVPMASKTNLQKSNGPPTTGSGDDDGQAEEYVLYQVVDDESCPADSRPKGNGKSTAADDSTGKSFGINAIFGIVIAALIVGVAYLFWNWNVVKTAAATAVAAASAAVAGSSSPAPPPPPPPPEESNSNSGNMSTGQLIFVLMISIIGCTFVAYVNGTMLYKANK
jgi:hypothetical protein